MGLCPSGFQPPMANKYCCCRSWELVSVLVLRVKVLILAVSVSKGWSWMLLYITLGRQHSRSSSLTSLLSCTIKTAQHHSQPATATGHKACVCCLPDGIKLHDMWHFVPAEPNKPLVVCWNIAWNDQERLKVWRPWHLSTLANNERRYSCICKTYSSNGEHF